MHLRLYAEHDWPAISEIYFLSKPDELGDLVPAGRIPRLEDDVKLLPTFRDSLIFVMEDAGQIVGFAGHRDNYISWLVVHPTHRRRGIGARLLSAVMASSGRDATLNVARCNAPAIGLYEKYGFRIEHEFVGKFQGFEIPVARMRHT